MEVQLDGLILFWLIIGKLLYNYYNFNRMRSNLVQELSSGQIYGKLMSLYELWNKFDVDVGYQNIITSYL